MAAQGIWVQPNPYSFISLLALTVALIGLHRRQSGLSSQLAKLGPGLATPRAIFVALLLGSCSLAVLSSVPVAAFRVGEHFFALLPVGIWLATSHGGAQPRHTGPLWLLAAVLAYIFLFYGSYLLDPTIDALN